MRLTAHYSRDIFVRNYDTAFNTPDEARRSLERMIIQLLKGGYDVTLAPPVNTPHVFFAGEEGRANFNRIANDTQADRMRVLHQRDLLKWGAK